MNPALPTLIRRTFGDYLASFQTEVPWAILRYTGPERRVDGGWAIPFEDTVSGDRYEVTITDAGAATGRRL